MGTGRKTVVVGQVIDPAWGNTLWDQSVQAFATAADRAAQFPAPKQGAVTWLEDYKHLEVYTGTAWTYVNPVFGLHPTGVTNSVGAISVPHGLPVTPRWAVCTMDWGATGDALSSLATPGITAMDTANILVRIRREDTHAWLVSNPVTFYLSYGL